MGPGPIAEVWRPYDEPAMPKSRECMGAGVTGNPVGRGADMMHMLFGGTAILSFGWEYADLKL